jgi:hypothetical protein
MTMADSPQHEEPPKGVGESMSRRAEDTAKAEPEAGREGAGERGGSGRPTGGSSARDSTSVNPQEPITGGPGLQKGDQGG